MVALFNFIYFFLPTSGTTEFINYTSSNKTNQVEVDFSKAFSLA